jgi:hypothetical protein
MSEESIIGDKGTLTIGSNAVTWFTFLQISRSTNSEQKGWNSKSHWREKGLDRLTKNGEANGFLATWTTNSRHPKALPEPRKHTFQFDERLKAQDLDLRAGKKTPKEGSENYINWKFVGELRKKGIISAYEVPLADERKGQLKADVMVFHDGGRIEIVELKCSGKEKNPDSPLMALTEAICYAIQAKRCWSNLAKEAEKHLGVKSLGSLTGIHLILAAPDYWNNCNPVKGAARRITREQVSKLKAIVAAVGAELPGVKLSLSLADIGEDGRNWFPIDESPEPPAWSILSSDKKVP